MKTDYYSLGNSINEKDKLISKQLEEYFDCVSNSVTETWKDLFNGNILIFGDEIHHDSFECAIGDFIAIAF